MVRWKMKFQATPQFRKQFHKTSLDIQVRFKKKLKIFLDNPKHPSLRIHKLKGNLKNFYSLSINESFRAIFVIIKPDIAEFVKIGDHSIYK